MFNLYPQNETHKEEIVIIQSTMCEMVPLEFILIISPNFISPIKRITFRVVIRMKTSWKIGIELDIKGWMGKVFQGEKDGTGRHSW